MGTVVQLLCHNVNWGVLLVANLLHHPTGMLLHVVQHSYPNLLLVEFMYDIHRLQTTRSIASSSVLRMLVQPHESKTECVSPPW